MTETAVARRSNQTIRRPSRKKEIKPSGGFYKAGGNEVPDARRVQQDANEKNIPYEIMSAEQTSEYAQVIVRAYAPNGQYIDDIVHHDFDNIQQLKALELLKKQVKGEDIYFDDEPIMVFCDLEKPFNSDGTPILTGAGYLKLLTEMARFKNFAIRDATTKAARRAQLKVLNKEWRNKGEIDAEKDEVRQVKESKKEEKKPNRRRVKKQGDKKPNNSVEDEVNNIVDAEFKKKPKKDKAEQVNMAPINVQELKGINDEFDKWINTVEDLEVTQDEAYNMAYELLGEQKLTPDDMKKVEETLGMPVK